MTSFGASINILMQSNSNEVIREFFDGALRTRIFTDPDYAYSFEARFRLDHALSPKLFSQQPPMHFHPYQDEFIRVVTGSLVVDVNGKRHVLTPDDEELCVRAWSNHRLYPLYPVDPPTNSTNGSTLETKVRVRGQQSHRSFQEDILFLENLTGYQEDIVMNKKPLSLLQVVCMFDAGGSYLSPPQWLPLGQHISRFMSVLVGRWLGGLLGYQPYYFKWSSDWGLACEKMKTSVFQRRFADRGKSV
ncbi:hypothetical protein F5Y18DRAFT_390466 [Xylariaceae sp. FL1019]|nr:hypothetical protein F5Y18DRAFT_390466 [Xylariaceae sp. FL1019]